MRAAPIAATLLVSASLANAETTRVAPSVFAFDTGVAFTLNNAGASDFLFNWVDNDANYIDVTDPTLILTAGETYTFQRLTSAHPFVITDDTLPVAGSEGSFFRTTTDGAVIDASTLKPIADFTADPAPTADFITWTPSLADVGDYFYTCRVTGHTGMTGRIEVVAPDLACNDADINGDGTLNLDDIDAFIDAFLSGCS